MWAQQRKGRVMNWESRADIYTLPCGEQTAGERLPRRHVEQGLVLCGDLGGGVG